MLAGMERGGVAGAEGVGTRSYRGAIAHGGLLALEDTTK